MEIKQRGLTKENLKRLFKFDAGDIGWIFFFAFLFLACYSYYDEMGTLKEAANTECCQRCRWDVQVEQYIIDFKEKNPLAEISCNFETKRCDMWGMSGETWRINRSISIADIEAGNIFENNTE